MTDPAILAAQDRDRARYVCAQCHFYTDDLAAAKVHPFQMRRYSLTYHEVIERPRRE
jgi:hypothetical protein